MGIIIIYCDIPVKIQCFSGAQCVICSDLASADIPIISTCSTVCLYIDMFYLIS